MRRRGDRSISRLCWMLVRSRLGGGWRIILGRRLVLVGCLGGKRGGGVGLGFSRGTGCVGF